MSKTAMRIEVVTPARAKHWLSAEVNKNNRSISSHTVRGYLNEMRAGRWVVGSPLMFNAQGLLIDGQHRLTALLEYGKGVPFAIMDGLDDLTREVIDQGRARSVPDILRMLYGQSRANVVTGAIRILDDFINGQKFKLSVGHALEVIERFDDAFKWAVDAIPGKSIFGASPIVAALVYAHKTAPSSVDAFARRMFVGAELPATSAILVVRNQIQRMGSLAHRELKREAFMIVLHAVYKTMHGQTVSSKSIRVREDMIDYFGEVYRSAKATEKKKAVA